jgi:hypothetical protein
MHGVEMWSGQGGQVLSKGVQTRDRSWRESNDARAYECILGVYEARDPVAKYRGERPVG